MRGEIQLIRKGLQTRDEKLAMVTSLGVKVARMLKMLNISECETFEHDLYFVEKEFDVKII